MTKDEMDQIQDLFVSFHEDDCTATSRFGIGCSCRFGILLDEILATFTMSDLGDKVKA